ncbi:NADH-quinone oxidoreductase subunit G [Aeromicrobium sp. CTD01-1L150]|uniref:NADH-quinone oxidoreductase subunit G n=1 Tax=Aeromicrobium sp. CTD01-1L150 TaxID=3341830 RepID=UPI0035BFDA26
MTVTDPDSTQTPVELVTLTIDDVEVSVPKGTLVIRAAELMGVDIPRFCDHPLLEPVGACRQCLVEVTDAGNGRGFPKPQASCTLEVAPGMVVKTQVTSSVAAKAQHGTMEFLLLNHPLDCPVCDKGGECPLQNQAMSHGRGESRFTETKRTFPKPYAISEQVLLDRERCVLCARCTRFSEQIAGDPFIALLERGAQQQVGIGPSTDDGSSGGDVDDEDPEGPVLDGAGQPFHSYFSGNTIQICPVGALTSADYRFRARPFDLVSTPSVAEHDACGSAIRVDHRRGKVMRRLAGDDPEVNEEWVTDKDRFAFTWTTQPDRLRTPLVRDEDGELQPASWPAALAVAARGLAAADGKVGVLPGGRLTVEDAFAYSTFARVALRTNDIDFRARAHSKEEATFLASTVASSRPSVQYSDLEAEGTTVVLVGLEPEDEAGTIFLRLRKGFLVGNTRVVSVGTHASRGLEKVGGELVATTPGGEPAALESWATDLKPSGPVIILAGERLTALAGGPSAVLRAAESLGARLAWVPRRAGDRAAVEAGCLPNLLPGGRPVSDAEARADLAAAWGVGSVPGRVGRDTAGIIKATVERKLRALVVGGVEVDDLPDPAAAREALAAADFVVSLEVRESDATRAADVVLPVAPAVEKPGTYLTWEGRRRPFEAVLQVPGALTDLRVLAGIAEELGVETGMRTISDARRLISEIGPWDGERLAAPDQAAPETPVAKGRGKVLLSTWRQMIDDARGQDGQDTYRATARPAVLRASAATLAAAGIEPGAPATVSTSAGSASFPAQVDDLPDGVVWVPGNNGVNLRDALRAGHGDTVTLSAQEVS